MKKKSEIHTYGIIYEHMVNDKSYNYDANTNNDNDIFCFFLFF